MLDLIEAYLDSTTTKIPTKALRDKAKSFKKELTSWPIEDIISFCEVLLEKRTRNATLFAYQLIYDQRKKYTKDTFLVFKLWTHTYIRDWWDCDDFMTHAVMYLLQTYPELIPQTHQWMTSKEFAVRRSVAVCLIPLARKNLIPFPYIKHVCNTLLKDNHYLVQKGYGWLLKESVKHYHDEVIEFLEQHVKDMPRTAFRYALEKLPTNEKERLMAL
jgi:3-methyladenine DNA glycosylase AlkD